MDATGWIITLVIIVFVVIIIWGTVASKPVSSRHNEPRDFQRGTTTPIRNSPFSSYSPPSEPPSAASGVRPPNVTRSPPNQEVQEPVIRVKRRRPPVDQSSTITISTPDTGLPNPIPLPSTIQVFFKQEKCSICKKNIHWSSRQTGWARCLSTKKLVHGHCYTSAAASRAENRANWCAVCGGPCGSGQPMRIEGKFP